MILEYVPCVINSTHPKPLHLTPTPSLNKTHGYLPLRRKKRSAYTQICMSRTSLAFPRTRLKPRIPHSAPRVLTVTQSEESRTRLCWAVSRPFSVTYVLPKQPALDNFKRHLAKVPSYLMSLTWVLIITQLRSHGSWYRAFDFPIWETNYSYPCLRETNGYKAAGISNLHHESKAHVTRRPPPNPFQATATPFPYHAQRASKP